MAFQQFFQEVLHTAQGTFPTAARALFQRAADRALASRGVCPILAGTLLLSLFVTSASAEVRQFGPEEQRFSVDVPQGWKDAMEKDTLSLVSPDGKSTCAITVFDSDGLSNEAILRRLQDAMPMKDISPTQDGWKFTTVRDKVSVGCILHITDELVLLSAFHGPQAQVPASSAALVPLP